MYHPLPPTYSPSNRSLANCAINTLERISLLYPHDYAPNYHVHVFEDIEDLFFISLTTNQKDVLGKDGRAVGMSDLHQALTPDEAKDVITRTKFVSSSKSVWECEVRSGSHPGILVEARVEIGFGDEHGNEHHNQRNDDLALPADAPAGTQNTDTKLNAPREDDVALHEQEKDLEQEYKAICSAKDDLMNAEAGQMGKIMHRQELKETIAKLTAEIRKVERTTLREKRTNVKAMEVEYWTKLRQVAYL